MLILPQKRHMMCLEILRHRLNTMGCRSGLPNQTVNLSIADIRERLAINEFLFFSLK